MKNPAVLSGIIYTGVSLIVTVGFLLATLGGNYRPLDRMGGAVWVFLLSMIILMPVVIQLVKKRSKVAE